MFKTTMLRDAKTKEALLTAALFIIAVGVAVGATKMHQHGVNVAVVVLTALAAFIGAGVAVHRFFFHLPRRTGHDHLVLAVLMAGLTIWAVYDAEYLKSVAWAGLTAVNGAIFFWRSRDASGAESAQS